MKKPKILFWDIETSPNLAYVWGKYEQNVIAYKNEWEILSFAYKFKGDKKVHCKTRADFKCKDDRDLVMELHKVLSSADIIVAHNGNSFDLKKANARFIFHKLPPTNIPSPIDTKLVAKRYFNFNSNSLNDLGAYLGLGQKVSTGGFQLWLDCMAGKKSAYKRMSTYNKQDVVLLEQVYNRFLPYIQNHPSLRLLKGFKAHSGCPNCGSNNVIKKGYRATSANIKRQMKCKSCDTWYLSPIKKEKK